MIKIYDAGAVSSHFDNRPKVTVRIGLFFDGTGNNRVNSRIGADCQALCELFQQAHTNDCGGRHSNPNSSYSNNLTNIARLVDFYRHQPHAQDSGDGLRVFKAIYISGVGTKSGGRDSILSGLGFGRGATGLVAKVQHGVRKLGESLRCFEDDNPGCVIGALELDLFGFSRGAAAARHMANEVLKQRRGLLNAVLDRRTLPLSAGFCWDNQSVSLKVIGLFDTVAAVGGLSDLGNVGDSVNARVNLFLPAGCAQQVLHLVAGDEHRRNFALNSVTPDWPIEIVLPGSHSDIGGGYQTQMLEKVALTRPRRSVVTIQTPYDVTDAWLQAHTELATLDARRWIDPHDPYATLGVECLERLSVSGRDTKKVVAAVVLERNVCGHLSLVHLRMMHALACDEGAPFDPIDPSPLMSLPLELREVSRKLLDYARQHLKGLASSAVARPSYGLSADELAMLYQRYIHCSAHWNGLLGRRGTLMDSMFVNAPQLNGRMRFSNVSQPGYPH
jgi:hypothetical protein